jgi:hypothetical protein
MAVCFGSGSDMLPETLRGRVHGLVSSAVSSQAIASAGALAVSAGQV